MELFDLYTELTKRLRVQRQKINCFFPEGSITNAQLDDMFENMFLVFEEVRDYLITSAKFSYHNNTSSCHMHVGTWKTEIKGEQAVKDIAALSQAGAVMLFIPNFVSIIRQLPHFLEHCNIKRTAPTQQQCFALDAYDFLGGAIEYLLDDLPLSVSQGEYPEDGSDQFELSDDVFFLIPEKERAPKIAQALHYSVRAAEALEETHTLPFHGEDLEKLKAGWSREIESEKNRERVRKRHQPNYERQKIIIDVYKNGGYKDQYNKSGNKTNTARHILKHVNERCRQENIPTLKEENLAGIKTIIKCIDEHMT